MSDENSLKESIVRELSGKKLTFEELARALSWSGDRRPLRKALADLVREGRVLRVPDYDRRRMVFTAAQ